MLLRARAGVASVGPALALLAFIAFIAQVGIAVMLPLLPLFATELGATPFVLGLLTSAFAVTNGIAQFGAGVLSDRYASRRLLAGGLALYASMNALIATSATAGFLLLWRALAGFGGGALIVTERIYLTEVTPAERRGLANGVLSAAASAGMVAGPAFGGLIAAVGGLRAPFVVVAVTSGIAFVISFFLPRSREPLTASAGTAPRPAMRLRGPALALLAANLLMLAGYGAFITTYAPIATERLGWTTVDVGLAFSFFGAGSILLGPALGHLSDRVGRRGVAMAGIAPVAVFGLSLVIGMPVWAVFAVAVLAGGGLTGFNASWFALLGDVTEPATRGRVFGIVSALSNAGIVVGALGAAQLWERVDLVAAMASGSVAIALAALPLGLIRLPRPSAASPTA
jgi:MFS transporter, DHA1 family, multidrug resistance protein